MKDEKDDPYRLFILGGYKIHRDFTDPEAYDEEILNRYKELVELAKKSLSNNAEKTLKNLGKLDAAFNKISTREKRIGFKEQKIAYLQNSVRQTKQYKLKDKTFYISHIGTLEFSEQDDIKEHLNQYLITIVNSEIQSVERTKIFTVLDINQLEKDNDYRDFILSTLFSDKSLETAEKCNYGYVGRPTKNDEEKYGIQYEVSELGAARKYVKEREAMLEEIEEQEL